MSENLRDRIAAALKAEDEKPHICPFDGEPTMASYDRLADAVIRELNLDISVYYKTSQGREVCIEGFWTEEESDD